MLPIKRSRGFYKRKMTVSSYGKGAITPSISRPRSPVFPTDSSGPFLAMLTSQRTAVITEPVFENRFMHVDELKRMGADIKIEGRSAIVQGIDDMYAATVVASDLRAGAALILAALIANGTSEIREIHHIERGYDNLDGKLRGLGAEINKVE